MSVIKFKLNTGQSEIILFGTKQKLKLVNIHSLSVAGTKVIISESPLRNLGSMFDFSHSIRAQVNSMVKTANVDLRNTANNLFCGVTSELLYHPQVDQNKAN